jgi:hypothetical protein
MRLRSILLPVVATSLMAFQAGAATVDKGSFKIYRKDKALGAETFEIMELQDSLVVRASQYLTIPTSGGDEPVERAAELYVNRLDFSLRDYQSTRTFRGETTRRGLAMSDTHYVAFRESGQGGVGESRVLPPGRLYVMDSQLVTLFDLICRSLHGRSFESRSLNLLALGPRDTMLVARATVVGNETIRWGGKPVVTRKLQLAADSQTTFTLWVSPQGRLLRLSEPVGGLRAEREPPPVKPRAAAAPKSGG